MKIFEELSLEEKESLVERYSNIGDSKEDWLVDIIENDKPKMAYIFQRICESMATCNIKNQQVQTEIFKTAIPLFNNNILNIDSVYIFIIMFNSYVQNLFNISMEQSNADTIEISSILGNSAEERMLNYSNKLKELDEINYNNSVNASTSYVKECLKAKCLI